MAASFDIKKIFRESWGYQPPVFDVVLQPEQSTTQANYFAKGLFGRPYFMPVQLGAVELPNPVIRITNRKTIVETALVGRPGTVKELIGQEDYKINIKGIIIMENNNYPEDEIKKIHKLYQEDKALTINSALTNILLGEDSTVVITDLSWPEMAGVQNVKTYEMNLISDIPFDLILK
jgi:hypothetical protein